MQPLAAMTEPKEPKRNCRVDGSIVLVPYDERWAEEYVRESSCIRAALGALLVQVHHIGSTSIPGLVAKPIIDILLVVAQLDMLDRRVQDLEAAHYEALGEFGIQGRRYFRKTTSEGKRTHQVHAFEFGSPQIHRHLAFRDYLRTHRSAALQYGQVKLELARQFPSDMASYTAGKTPFIRDIEQRAASMITSSSSSRDKP
jgi:GrpB-like predicted nucleotidyltransferase (UPF0157 family)